MFALIVLVSLVVPISATFPNGESINHNGPISTEESLISAPLYSRITLKCKTQFYKIKWVYLLGNGEYNEIYENGDVVPHLRHEVEATKVGYEHHLIIKNATAKYAGTYRCRASNSRVDINVVLFDKYPSDEHCSTVVASTTRFHGNDREGRQCPNDENVTVSCRIRYKGNVHPSIKWLDNKGYVISSKEIWVEKPSFKTYVRFLNGPDVIHMIVLVTLNLKHSQKFSCIVEKSNMKWSTDVQLNHVDITETREYTNPGLTVPCLGGNEVSYMDSILPNKCVYLWKAINLHGRDTIVETERVFDLTNHPKDSYYCSVICTDDNNDEICEFKPVIFNYTEPTVPPTTTRIVREIMRLPKGFRFTVRPEDYESYVKSRKSVPKLRDLYPNVDFVYSDDKSPYIPEDDEDYDTTTTQSTIGEWDEVDKQDDERHMNE